jgi:hypothetical protein
LLGAEIQCSRTIRSFNMLRTTRTQGVREPYHREVILSLPVLSQVEGSKDDCFRDFKPNRMQRSEDSGAFTLRTLAQ